MYKSFRNGSYAYGCGTISLPRSREVSASGVRNWLRSILEAQYSLEAPKQNKRAAAAKPWKTQTAFLQSETLHALYCSSSWWQATSSCKPASGANKRSAASTRDVSCLLG